MSGKPAARQGDMTRKGADIVQGSAGVLIGAPTGVACSVCPGGVTYGPPVNPLLGAKVLPGETDVALPGPLPFVMSRAYSSYRTKTPAPSGILGPGWKLAADMRLQLRDNELILNDNGGRSIHFEPLTPGEVTYSRSEAFWLARGGVLKLSEGSPLAPLWARLPEDIRLSPHSYLAANSAQGPWWILGWAERVPGADEVLPAPLPPYRVLTGLADGYGRVLTYHRDAAGVFSGHITGVTDGAGRRFRLVLNTQAQRAEAARQAGSATARQYPGSLPADTDYCSDEGIRLQEVWLVSEPGAEVQAQEPVMLVRYEYTPRGELAAVYDRSGVQVRHFTYDLQYPGRMTGHGYAGRPAMRYVYDSEGRVTEQVNPAGLSYRYGYEKDRVTITDSLGRREVLHTEGEGGLKRVVKKVFADGSVTHSQYDPAGRLTAQTDAAGRTTEYRLHVASGVVTAITGHDGRKVSYGYNGRLQQTSTVWPDGLRSSREYDDAGRLTAETGRSGETTRYSYDNPQSELPSSVLDATGSTKQMAWSRYGQLLAFTDCSGYETRYEYDRFGRQTAVHREEGLSVYRHYNNRGQLTAVRDNAGRETRYDYNEAGDLIAVTGPDGTRSEMQYDSWGKAVAATQGGLTRRMAYDAAGRVTQLTNENGSHSGFTWDVLDRLVEQSGFDGRTQRYGYDITGRLTQSEDEDILTCWHYDESDRLTYRTINGEPAEQWQYDKRGWLTDISHISEGHQVAVHYEHDDRGRRISERQTVHNPQTGELLWGHETQQGYSEQGLATRQTPDGLPAVEWLTYGSGYLAGMKLGETSLLEYTRDRLHREVLRRFGSSSDAYEQSTEYSLTGQLQGQHLTLPALNREYGYDEGGHLTRISGPQESREYRYTDTGRLTGVRTTSINLDMTIPYATDAAGNRLPDPELHPDSTLTTWPDNRITQDAQYEYRYDRYGNLTEKTDRIPEGVNRMYDERTHRYRYDNQHRLVHYIRTQYDKTQAEGRYVYDPLGRRVGKQVWKREREHPDHEQMALSRRPYTTWYGWEGDRLATVRTQKTKIQTIYGPGSFTPLLRIETDSAELDKAEHRTLADVLQQGGSEDGGDVVFPAELVRILDRLEGEIRRNQITEESREWLAGCGLTVEQMAAQMEKEYTPERTIHLYHCDHRGLPLALVSPDNGIAWRGEYDEWGNLLNEDSPQEPQLQLQQLIRLPGQQYDEESGLYYNRNRYYSPEQGRYITQDPIGLRGGWNPYQYPLNPITNIDPLGLNGWDSLGDGGIGPYCQGIDSAVRFLPQEDAAQVIHNAETMHNAYNPLGEYVLGVATAPAIAGMSVYGGTASVVERSAACIESVANSMITKNERAPEKLMLTCAKSFINKGTSKFQVHVSDFLVDTLFSYSQKQ